jgi:hypothetical protein
MPQVSGTFKTTDAVGNREQLMDAIYEVFRNEVPFTGQVCGRADVTATKPEWQTEDMPAPNPANAAAEGANAGAANNFRTTRVENHTQIFEHVAQVSSTQETVKKAGRGSEMAYQKRLATRKVLRDIEAAALSAHEGTSGATRRMRGLSSWLSTNNSHAGNGSTNATTGVVTDGTARNLTKAMLVSVMQKIAEQGGATGVPMTVLAGAFNRGKLDEVISAGGSERQIAASKKEVVDPVDIWQSSYGPVKIVYSPQQTTDSGCRARDIFIVQDDMFDMGYLQNLASKPLAVTGHSTPEMVSAECTLICKNERASGKVADLTTA